MFEYSKIYDKLFESEKFKEVLYKFHSSNWKELDVNGRYKIVKEFIECYCEVLGLDKIDAKKISMHFSGAYSDFGGIS